VFLPHSLTHFDASVGVSFPFSFFMSSGSARSLRTPLFRLHLCNNFPPPHNVFTHATKGAYPPPYPLLLSPPLFFLSDVVSQLPLFSLSLFCPFPFGTGFFLNMTALKGFLFLIVRPCLGMDMIFRRGHASPTPGQCLSLLSPLTYHSRLSLKLPST